MDLIPVGSCACVQTKGCASSFPEACGRKRGVLMLLVLDVGNTNTVLGVYENVATGFAGDKGSAPRLAAPRGGDRQSHTGGEKCGRFRNLFAIGNVEAAEVNGIIISSVVPPMDSTLREVCERYFHLRPLFVEPGIKTGMPVLYENPQEVGADRIVNGVAAFEKFGGPCVVVDLGTATTFDAISRKGEYLGGVISPGIGISARALYEHTARLPLVDIRKPAKVIGTNTVGSIQAGLFFGYLRSERKSTRLNSSHIPLS